MKRNRYPQFLATITIFLLSMLSCRPVFAIGWEELIILLVITVFLLGPVLLKVYRTFDRIRKADNSEEKKKK